MLEKPRKRALLIAIPNERMFVLGFHKERKISIMGYDVTYEYIPEYDLSAIHKRFKAVEDRFDMFAFIGFASDDALKAVAQRQKVSIRLPRHLLKDWTKIMGDTLPHYSYFCLPRSDMDRLIKNDAKKMTSQWKRLSPELQSMLDVRNMILS